MSVVHDRPELPAVPPGAAHVSPPVDIEEAIAMVAGFDAVREVAGQVISAVEEVTGLTLLELSVLDAIRDGRRTAAAMVPVVHAPTLALRPVLRSLAGQGLVAADPNSGRFRLTAGGVARTEQIDGLRIRTAAELLQLPVTERRRMLGVLSP